MTSLDSVAALPEHRVGQENLSNYLREAMVVQLRFLGKNTQGGGSPTLYATDRGTYVVQGWAVPGQETSVEIPMRLLEYVEANTTLGSVLHTTDHGTYVISGAVVSDAQALAQMDVPSHERCIEVDKVRKGDADETATRPGV